MLALYAALCNADQDRALRLYDHWRLLLQQATRPDLHEAIGAFEYVLTPSTDGTSVRYGMLTRGPTTTTLPERIQACNAMLQTLYATWGGGASGCQLIDDIFRIAFPEPQRLQHFSADAHAVVLGLVPHRETVTAKVYLNTQLDAAQVHRDHVVALFDRVGICDHARIIRAYDVLYTHMPDASFYGIGVDIREHGDGRAKLYVSVPTSGIHAAIPHLITTMLPHVDPDQRSQWQTQWGNFVNHVVADASHTTEIGIGLLPSGMCTLKCTVFLSAYAPADTIATGASAAMQSIGYDATILQKSMQCATPSTASARQSHARSFLELLTQRKTTHPLHAIGLEWGVDAAVPKVNLYLQPRG